MKKISLLLLVVASMATCAAQAKKSTISTVEAHNSFAASSITQSQDNRDPKEVLSSAESRKRRRKDELQR